MSGRLILLASFAFFAATGLAEAAPTATLDAVSGRVLVDNGKGFAVVTGRVQLRDDARVLVTATAEASLRYADGCRQTLSPNTITTVSSATACQEQAQVAGQAPAAGGAGAGAAGGAAGAAGGAMGVIGGVVAGAAFAGAIAGAVANELAASP